VGRGRRQSLHGQITVGSTNWERTIRVRLDQYPINSARRSQRAQAGLRRSNPPTRPTETLITTETADDSSQFPRRRTGIRRRPRPGGLRAPPEPAVGFSWTELDFFGLSWCALGFPWIFFGFPWISLALDLDFSMGYDPSWGIWRFFSPPRPRSRPGVDSDHEHEPKARMARRGCGMGTATLRFCVRSATQVSFLFCSVKFKARRMPPEVAEWLTRRPPLMRAPDVFLPSENALGRPP